MDPQGWEGGRTSWLYQVWVLLVGSTTRNVTQCQHDAWGAGKISPPGHPSLECLIQVPSICNVPYPAD